MFKKLTFAIAIFALTSSAAFGEQKKSNEIYPSPDIHKQVDDMLAQFSYQLKSTVKVMNDPELIKAQAKYAKNLYEAFIAEGFSKEQALELVKVSIEGKK